MLLCFVFVFREEVRVELGIKMSDLKLKLSTIIYFYP